MTNPTPEQARQALEMLNHRKWGYWTGDVDDATKREVTKIIRALLTRAAEQPPETDGGQT